MSKEVINTLLEPLDTTETVQILAAQFRILVRGLKMTPERWDQLMADYARRKLGADAHAAEVASLCGNLNKELMQPIITWKIFLKGLDVLDQKVTTMFFTTLTHGGETTASSSTIVTPKQ